MSNKKITQLAPAAVPLTGVEIAPVVQSAATVQTTVANILGTAAGASLIVNTPAGTIAATTVQGAINEIVSDLAASSGSSLVGYLPSGTGAIATIVQTKLRESVSVKDFGADPTGVADSTAAIQAALNTGAHIYLPKGTYKITSAILPLTTQMICGDGVNVSVLKAATAGMICISYPSGAWNNIYLRDFSIDGNSVALTGISIISSSQGASSSCLINNVQVANCTLYQIYLSKLTYSKVDHPICSGGQYGLFLNSCYSTHIANASLWDCSQAPMLMVSSTQILVSKTNFFQNAVTSPALVIIDASYGNSFVDCEFEPQGTGSVTSEVILKNTVTVCSQNTFTRCRFIGLPTTKTNCVAVGTTGAVYTTQFIQCGFIKPSAANSISLQTQQEAQFVRCYDLVTYNTTPYAPVSIDNPGTGSYYVESLAGQFNNVITKQGISFPAVQNPSTDVNTLDDYEEGTWTVSLTGSITNPTGVAAANSLTANYIKIGKLVFVTWYSGAITWSGAGSGIFYVAGLPYFGGSAYNAGSVSNCSFLPTAIGCHVDNPARISFNAVGAATDLTWASAVSGGTLMVSAFYIALT